jgi:TonB family protein
MMMTMVLIMLCALAGTPSQQTAQPQPIASGFGAGAYPYGAAFPSLDRIVEPNYPAGAILAGIEGEVLLELVVGTNGGVTDVRVTKSLDKIHGLDAAASDAIKQWSFRPATLGGKNVAAIVYARVVFYLKQPGSVEAKPFVEAGLRPGPKESFPDGVYIPSKSNGVSWPMPIREARPKYTPQAMREKIQGAVELEIVVGADGQVAAARVVRSLDSKFGLDNAAIEAAKQWRFSPGRLNGVPVPVRVGLVLEFRLN